MKLDAQKTEIANLAPENIKVFATSHLLGLLLAQLVGNVLQPFHLGVSVQHLQVYFQVHM